MSEINPYEQLGIERNASFDEVQQARNRLLQQCGGDRQRQQLIEAAYDAILMERLRLRQEGKIKVPERIRFPEKLVPPPAAAPSPVKQSPEWLQKLIDTPQPTDILWPAGVFLVLSIVSLTATAASSLLQLALAIGVAASLYFLNRKERKFGRAVLLTLTGLLGGLVLGGLLSQLGESGLSEEKFITLVTFVVLWLVSSFLK
ncbi:MAG: CPP1-like family protein [Oscillatoriaceae bacterium SKW80]|nr:CPP1-like family protein [Oscillatoriaceae bacterium SKYG93]MCX8119552.1 CPP1-like family protein [Oscillatoriaceae bacterium SKW80]MDW8455019.1 CPP1-like family protein [Oscillatoriaceae cyanobacterium SKYGB_i_bin93]HIK28204.1 CPP1-like family protein [Oscillatoriaceae cyanobacterium M7585_C2015_266]